MGAIAGLAQVEQRAPRDDFPPVTDERAENLLQVQQPGLTFHLLGLTAITLMVGWSLSVVAATLALAAVTFNTGGGWESFAVNAMVGGVIPVTLTHVLLILIRWYLPRIRRLSRNYTRHSLAKYCSKTAKILP